MGRGSSTGQKLDGTVGARSKQAAPQPLKPKPEKPNPHAEKRPVEHQNEGGLTLMQKMAVIALSAAFESPEAAEQYRTNRSFLDDTAPLLRKLEAIEHPTPKDQKDLRDLQRERLQRSTDILTSIVDSIGPQKIRKLLNVAGKGGVKGTQALLLMLVAGEVMARQGKGQNANVSRKDVETQTKRYAHMIEACDRNPTEEPIQSERSMAQGDWLVDVSSEIIARIFGELMDEMMDRLFGK